MMRKSVCGERGCRAEEEEHMSLICLHRLLHDRPLDYQWWGGVQAGVWGEGLHVQEEGVEVQVLYFNFGK